MPSTDASGRDIYKQVFSKIETHWQFNELEEMKEKSRMKAQPSVLRSQTISRGYRKSNINVCDMDMHQQSP